MTFDEAYALHGADTIAIAQALDIPEHEADRLVNEEMDRAAGRRVETHGARGRPSEPLPKIGMGA